MKLSEAIRMNGMMKPQGFGAESYLSLEAPCVLGGALQMIGKLPHSRDYSLPITVWEFLMNRAKCPACSCARRINVLGVLTHLNDWHKWTRSQIADWVETVEPAEPAQEQTCELVCTETTV